MDLDSTVLDTVVIRLLSVTKGHLIAFDYYMYPKSYHKVYLWEVDAWDKNSIWGAKITPKPQQNTLCWDLGIWGWGNNKYSSLLQQGEGPTLYNALASLSRNYHNMDWDVLDPDNDPEYTKMREGRGTNAKWWLNWDTEYRAW